MNIITNNILEMIENIIKNRCEHFDVPLEQRAAPDITEFWRLDMSYFDIENLAKDIIKVVETSLSNYLIEDLLKDNIERGEE